MQQENVVYLCPNCLSFDSLKSAGDRYRCSCGFEVTLDDYGFFKGEKLPFDNVCEWETWQRAWLSEYAEEWLREEGRYICSQNDVVLSLLEKARTDLLLDGAEMLLYSNKLVFQKEDECLEFPLCRISGVSNFRNTALIFTVDGVRREVRTAGSWPVFKYIALIRLLSQKKYL